MRGLSEGSPLSGAQILSGAAEVEVQCAELPNLSSNSERGPAPLKLGGDSQRLRAEGLLISRFALNLYCN